MSPASLVRRASAAVHTAAGQAVGASRLMLAAKTAIAAAAAWYLAPYVPFADADYSYYAPLGVLVSMHPTVVESMRSGLLALAGLGGGIALGLCGLLVVNAGAPGILAIALVVGAGAVLGGIRALGTGREWIAISGLFVLLIGGSTADEFSVSYLVTMGFGVVIGIAANYVVPPVYLHTVQARLSELRARIAAGLQRMAEMVGAGQVDRAELNRAADQLATLSAAVATEVQEGDRSRRANPRARRMDGLKQHNDDHWWELEWSTIFARDLADLLGRYPQISDGSHGSAELLALALEHTAAAVAAQPDAPDTAALTDEAVAATDDYLASLQSSDRGLAQSRHSLTVACAIGSLTDMTRSVAWERDM